MIFHRQRERRKLRENLSQAERDRLRASIQSEHYMERAIASIAESLLLGQRSLIVPMRLVYEREQKLATAKRIRANIVAARASNVKRMVSHDKAETKKGS